MGHEKHVAVLPQVEPATDQRAFGPPALDNQERDVRPLRPQFVGDPGEGVNPFLRRRVHERHVTRLVSLDAHPLPIHEVGQHLAFQPERPAVMRGREVGRDDHPVHIGERGEVVIEEVVEDEDRRDAATAGAGQDRPRERVATVGRQNIGPEAVEDRVEQPEKFLGLRRAARPTTAAGAAGGP